MPPRRAVTPPQSPVSIARLVSTTPTLVKKGPPPLPTPLPATPLIVVSERTPAEDADLAKVVEDAVAPVRHELYVMQSRLEELEHQMNRLPPPAPPPVAVSERPPPAAMVSMVVPVLRAQAPAPAPVLPGVVNVHVHAPAVSIEAELRSLDGGRRQRRAVATLAALLVLVMGGLLGAVAWSYVGPAPASQQSAGR
jgi:hypothetical protein